MADAEGIGYGAGAGDEAGEEFVAVYIQHEAAEFAHGDKHGGVVEGAGADFAAAAGYHVDGTVARNGSFHIGARPVRVPARVVADHARGIEGAAETIVSIKKEAAFVGVAVSTEDEVDAVAFEERKED